MGTIKIKNAEGNWVKLPNYGIQNFPEAPVDDKIYGRKNSQWVEFKGGDDKVYLSNTATAVDANRIIFSYSFTMFLLNGEYEALDAATNEELEEMLGCTIQELNNVMLTKVDSETSFVFPCSYSEEDTTGIFSYTGSVASYMKQGDKYQLIICSNIEGLTTQIIITNIAEDKELTLAVYQDPTPLRTPQSNETSEEFYNIFGFYPWTLTTVSSSGSVQWNSPTVANIKLHYDWLDPSFFELTSTSTDEEIKTALGSRYGTAMWRGFKYFHYFDTFEAEYYNGNMKIISVDWHGNSSTQWMDVIISNIRSASRTTISMSINLNLSTNTFSITNYYKSVSPQIYTRYDEPTSNDGVDGDLWIQYTV